MMRLGPAPCADVRRRAAPDRRDGRSRPARRAACRSRRWRPALPESTPAASRRSRHGRGLAWRPCRSPACGLRHQRGQSTGRRSPWPVTKVTAEATRRSVSGMPTEAAQPSAAVMPGTTVDRQARRAAARRPPRRRGRTRTDRRPSAARRVWPARTRRTSSASISACAQLRAALALADTDQLGVAARAVEDRPPAPARRAG